MIAALFALVQFAHRLAVAIVLACLVALLLAVLREDAGFGESFRIASLLVGCLALLLAVAGHSPSMRLGTMDPWYASFVPKLIPILARPYAGTRLSSSAILALTGFAMLAIGVALGG